jgi:hypothetical protein
MESAVIARQLCNSCYLLARFVKRFCVQDETNCQMSWYD